MAFSDFFKKGGKNSANAAKIGKTAQERKDISIEILKSQGGRTLTICRCNTRRARFPRAKRTKSSLVRSARMRR